MSPLAARAQQPARRLAWLVAFPERSPLAAGLWWRRFRRRYSALDGSKCRNLSIDYRFAAGGTPALFKSYATDLVRSISQTQFSQARHLRRLPCAK